MKPATKKNLATSFCLLSVAAILSWYVFPTLMGKWVLHNSTELKRYLNIVPTYINELPAPPPNWDPVSLGTLTLRLPMSKYKKVSGNTNHLALASENDLLVISGLIPSTELLQAIEEHNLEGPLSYEMELDIYETVPADIYFLKSRRNSKIDSANLILKAVGIPAGGLAEVVAVRTGMLKGICTLSERGEKGLNAIAHLYNNKGNVAFTAMLMNYEDEKALKMDLLAVLGGLRLPDQPLNAMAVENDIVALVDKYKRAEPVH